MEPTTQPTFDEMLATIHAVLGEHPDAQVAALDSGGIFRDLPPEIALGPGHAPLGGRTFFEHVAPESVNDVMTGWQEAREHGVAVRPVRSTDGEDWTIHCFNTVVQLDLTLCLWVRGTPSGEDVEAAEPVRVSSRFGRFRRDIVATIVDVDDDAVGLLGWTPADLEGVLPGDLIHPDDQENSLANWMRGLASPGVPQRWRGRHRRRDGSYIWLEFTNTNRLDDPEHGYVLSEMMDISEEMATAEELRKGKELLHRLTESLPVGVVQIDVERRIQHRNDQLLLITGHRKATTIDEQLVGVVEDDRIRLDEALDGVLMTGTRVELEVRIRPEHARQERVCQLTVQALRDSADGIEGAVVCVADVTDSTRMRQELEVRATFDPLTSCYNRASTMAVLERALASRQRPGYGTAVIFVDLDGFKAVNDQLGHAAGDELLATVASRLRSGVRGDDIVGRFGGDEFLVVCPTVAGPDEAMEIADRLVRAVHVPMSLAGEERCAGASTGVAWAQPEDATPDSLVAAADAAMYRSKREGASLPVLAGS